MLHYAKSREENHKHFLFLNNQAKFVRRGSLSKPTSAMAASSQVSVLRRSSIATERPERLSSRGPSPYLSKLNSQGNVNANRRVQSAATSRQKSALAGPTVKASEFFRKNQSEPPGTASRWGFPNKNGSSIPSAPSSKLTKPTKQVRIDTDRNSSAGPSSRSLGIHGTKSFTHGRLPGESALRKTPFSFCSDRSRSVSVTSNDSISTLENDPQDNISEKDYENNNSNPSSRNSSAVSSDSYRHKVHHPPLQKQVYSMDGDSDQEDRFWSTSPQQEGDQFDLKIAEHPEDALMEENKTLTRPQSQDSVKSELRRALTSYDDDRPVHSGRSRSASQDRRPSSLKGSDIDRMLIMQSDTLLEGVDSLLNEIKSSETSKQLEKSSSIMSKADSVDQLVEDLKNDINKYDNSLLGSVRPSFDKTPRLSTVDEFNFNALDLSGIELTEITCPSQVMEQSALNTSRLERPISAVVLGNENMCIIEEAENYLMMNRGNSFKSSDSLSDNNQTVSSSEALSIIHQQASSARTGSGRAPSSGFDISQEEIQRKLCSALRLLEEEEKQRTKNSSRGESFSSRRETNSEPSPYVTTSNPGTESDSSSKIRSEEKIVLDSQSKSEQSERRIEQQEQKCLEPQSARSCSCLLDPFSNESLSSARSCKTTSGIVYHGGDGLKSSQVVGGGDGIWETKDDKTKYELNYK